MISCLFAVGVPEPDPVLVVADSAQLLERQRRGIEAEAIARALGALGLLQGSEVQYVPGALVLAEYPMQFGRADWVYLKGKIDALIPVRSSDAYDYINTEPQNISSKQGKSDLHFRGGKVSAGRERYIFFSVKWNSIPQGADNYDIADIKVNKITA